jgi:hypothetical protein
MKKLALIIIIAAAIVLAVFFLKPTTTPISTSNLTISNFAFFEVLSGPDNIKLEVEPQVGADKFTFSGPLTKPTPCNGLTASYIISGNTVVVNITTTPFEGFCSQVMTDTFYQGSFEALLPTTPTSLAVQVYYGGNLIGNVALVTADTKESACINSGGTVSTAQCCLSAEDFPNSCLIGACGCSLENSHEVKVCDCPNGCFDGEKCLFGT